MSRRTCRKFLLAAASVAALCSGAIETRAGGFALREQSAYFQGSVFAGAAAGGPSLSSMFWNPATMTQHRLGLTAEGTLAGVIGNSEITPTSATSPAFPGLLALGGSGDIAQEALVPAAYAIYKPNDRLALGIAMNSPWGLVTHPHTFWAGMFHSRVSKVFTFNATPMVSYQLTDWLSIGAGAQVQYFRTRLDSAFPGSPTGETLRLKADSIDLGFVAGVTLTPTPWTQIGIGYRSRIDQQIDGQATRPAFLTPVGPLLVAVPAATADVRVTVPLPDTLSIGIRQRVSPNFTLLGTFEWATWSRMKTLPIAVNPLGTPGVPTALPFEWRDGYFASVGAEYQWSPTFSLRAGVGFEQSPIDDDVRGTRLPDNDRIWVGIGATYNWSDRLAFDLGYSHIFVKDAPINIVPGHPLFNPALGTFTGNAETHVDIISVGFRYRWGADPVKPIVTKG
jgi:long-chain fatty acid transport protein